MNHPGSAKYVHDSLKPDGTWMIVEPYAKETIEENLNPVGRIFYNASSMVCVPTSLAQEVGLGLGAQAGDSKIEDVVKAGGRLYKNTEGHRDAFQPSL